MSELARARVFECATARAVVYDQGAHIVEWTPVGHAPVLWVSASAEFRDGFPIRGGVPICWPWFSAGPSGDRTPSHGVARTRRWDFVSAQAEPQTVACRYRLVADDVTPRGVEVALTATFGRSLGLALHVVNGSATSFEFEEALHTYLSIGDIEQVSIEGLDGCEYREKSAEEGLVVRHQRGAVRFTGETDRIYRTSDTVVVRDPVLARRLRITRSGSADLVVWNPWVDKARAMADMAQDGWRTMVCVEGANIADAAIRLEPGEVHTMGYEIDVLAWR